MANPQDTGTFEQWITDQIDFEWVPPKSGDTGDFETWLTDRLDVSTFVEAAGVAALEITVVATDPDHLIKGVKVVG